MMTDGELLELAAKAYASEDVIKTMRGFERVVGYSEAMCCQIMTEWNPLTDDGDALRLAVKLRIDVAHARDYVVSGLGTAGSMRRENGDDCTATRRAIVRAAAEIGRSMP